MVDPFLSILDFVSVVVLSLLALISVTNCPISIFQFHYISLHFKSPGAHKYLSAPDFTHSLIFFRSHSIYLVLWLIFAIFLFFFCLVVWKALFILCIFILITSQRSRKEQEIKAALFYFTILRDFRFSSFGCMGPLGSMEWMQQKKILPRGTAASAQGVFVAGRLGALRWCVHGSQRVPRSLVHPCL